MNFLFPISMAAVSFMHAYKHIKLRNKAVKATNSIFQQQKSQGIQFKKISETKQMNTLLLILIGLTCAVAWINDSTGMYVIQSVCFFVLVILLIELIYIDLRYSLFYNDNGFIHYGNYYPYKRIKAVGYSKYFFKLGKVFFTDRSFVTCFKDGLEIIHNQFKLFQSNS